jgi:nicotinamidase-related amidase
MKRHIRKTFLLTALAFLPAFASAKTAVVIIDMQAKFVERGGQSRIPENIRKLGELTKKQLEVIELAKREGTPIIVIRYSGYGETSDAIKNAVLPGKTMYFDKNTDGMLEDNNHFKADYLDYLRRNNIDKFVILGANGGACVAESMRGSFKNNFSVIAYAPGIADFNFENFIYPFAGKYGFEPKCSSCTFRETSDFHDVEKVLHEEGGAEPRPAQGDTDLPAPRTAPAE